MRRHMRAAAAASILFLAAGTGAAQAQSPFGESFAEGIRQIAAFNRLVSNVEVEVTQTSVAVATQTLTIKWRLSDEDASIADDQSGYCVRVKVGDGDSSWEEKCFSEAPDSAQLYPSGRTRYTMDMTNDDWPNYGTHYVTVQVKMEYGTGSYTSWSDEFSRWELFGITPP